MVDEPLEEAQLLELDNLEHDIAASVVGHALDLGLKIEYMRYGPLGSNRLEIRRRKPMAKPFNGVFYLFN